MATDQAITDDAPEAQTPARTLDEEIAASILATDEATEAAIADLAPEGEEPVESESPDGTEDAGPTPEEETPAPTASEELTTANDEITRLNKEAAERKTEAESQQLEANVRVYADQYARGLVNTGDYTEEQAKVHAEAQRRAYMAEHQLGVERKQNLARELSVAHGVSVSELMVAQSDEEMALIATKKGPENKRVTALEVEVRELKKARVPVQPYAQQAARTSATSEDQLLDQYNAGMRNPATEAAGRRAANGQ